MILTKQVTLATRTKHSGPMCLWQCFRVQTCWMRRYRFEGVLNYNLLLCRNVKNILLKLITLSLCNIKSLIHFPLVWLEKKVILLKKCFFVCQFLIVVWLEFLISLSPTNKPGKYDLAYLIRKQEDLGQVLQAVEACQFLPGAVISMSPGGYC